MSWCHCDLVLICRSFSRINLEIEVVMLITWLPEHRAREPEGLALLLPEAQPVFPRLVPLPTLCPDPASTHTGATRVPKPYSKM